MSATAPSTTGTVPAAPGRTIVARLILLMTFLQPFFIGAMFSGYRDGLDAHAINA